MLQKAECTLKPVHPTKDTNPRFSPPSGDAKVDLVFVHGFNGDLQTTWMDESSGKFWIADPEFLGDLSVKCRVLSFGYNANVARDLNPTHVHQHASNLLRRLFMRRQENEKRPIIFVAHSLGGIVVKRALIMAGTNSDYRNIALYTKGIIFLGTPHRGSEHTNDNLLAIAEKMIELASSQSFILPLIEESKPYSSTLAQINLEFSHDVSAKIKMVSVYEMVQTRFPDGKVDFIVPEGSAVMNHPNEAQVGMNSTHEQLCRFAEPDARFMDLWDELNFLVKIAMKTEEPIAGASAQDPDMEAGQEEHFTNKLAQNSEQQDPPIRRPDQCSGLSRLAKTSALERNSGPKTWTKRDQDNFLHGLQTWNTGNLGGSLSEPYIGTCQWVLARQEFQTWRDDASHNLLFITGPSGCGKSSIAQYITKYLEGRSDTLLLKFFCKNVQGSNNSPSLISFIVHQLLRTETSLFRHVFPRYSSLKSWSRYLSQGALFEILRSLLEDPVVQKCTIVIDGLDEYDHEYTADFLRWLTNLCSTTKKSASGGTVKILIVSQPTQHIEAWSREFLRLTITEDYTTNDIKALSDAEIERISHVRGYTEESRAFLKLYLTTNAEGNFQWVSLVLKELENSSRDTDLSTLRLIVRSCSNNLAVYYRTEMTRLNIKAGDWKSLLFLVVVFARKDLTVSELQDVLSLETSTKVSASQITTAIRRVFSRLLKVDKNNVVSLIHQSLREFLNSQTHGVEAPEFVVDRTILSSSNGNSVMASLCLKMLLLDELKSITDLLAHGKVGAAKQLYYKHYPFMEYARRSWGHHLRDAGSLEETNFNLLSRFIEIKNGQSAYLRWDTINRWLESGDLSKFSTPILHVLATFNLRHVLECCEFLTPAQHSPGLHSFWRLLQKPFSFSSFDKQRGLLQIAEHFHIRDLEDHSVVHICAATGAKEFLELLAKLTNVDVDATDIYGNTPTHLATHRSQLSVLRLLLELDAKPNIPAGDTGYTPLHCISYIDDANLQLLSTQCLIAGGANPNCRTSDGLYPLGSAIDSGIAHNLTIASLVTQESVNYEDPGGETALTYAIKKADLVLLEWLLSVACADPNVKNCYGRAPIHVAAFRNDAEAVQLLLRYNADVNAVTGPLESSTQKVTALQTAVAKGSLEVTTMLLDAEADTQVTDQEGGTLLHNCIEEHNYHLWDLLINTGIDVNSQDNYGHTALWYALESPVSVDVISTLLQRGARVRENVDCKGCGPLHISAESGNKLATNIILKHCSQADIDDHGLTYCTPLQCAAAAGHIGTVKLLLEAKTDLHLLWQGSDAISMAASRNKLDVVKILLEYGADPLGQDGRTASPLHSAAFHGNIAMLMALIERNTQLINHPLENGQTCLFEACKHGNIDMVKSMVTVGADIHVKDHQGGTIMYYACLNGNAELVQHLHTDYGLTLYEKMEATGETLLHAASWSGSVPLIQYLTFKGVRISRAGQHGLWPLHYTTARCHWYACLVLLNLGHPLEATDNSGRNALAMAVEYEPKTPAESEDHLRIVKLLLSHGADATAINSTTQNSLLFSAFGDRTWRPELAEILIDAPGTNILNTGIDGSNILHYAIGRNERATTRYILSSCQKYDREHNSCQLQQLLESRNGRGLTPYEMIMLQCMFSEQDANEMWHHRQRTMRYMRIDTLMAYIEAVKDQKDLIVWHRFLRLLLWLDDDEHASFLGGHCFMQEDGKFSHMAYCNNCRQNITTDRYICRVCEDIDLCEECMWLHVKGRLRNMCIGHRFFRLEGGWHIHGRLIPPEDFPISWLEQLESHYLQQKAIMEHDFHDNPPQGQMILQGCHILPEELAFPIFPTLKALLVPRKYSTLSAGLRAKSSPSKRDTTVITNVVMFPGTEDVD